MPTLLAASVHRFSSLPSTNQKAIELARAGAPEGTTVIAEEQTAGRGRFDRRWYSPPGEGLYHSIILRPSIPPAAAPVLTLLVAVALVDSLKSGYEISADIKWPNDILVMGKKCAGILSEMEATNEELDFVVVGIGVNLNQRVFPPEVGDLATSVLLEAGSSCEPEEFRQRLFGQLDSCYQTFKREGAAWVIEQWINRSSFAYDRAVSVDLGQGRFSGISCGLREDGALLVKTGDGRITSVVAGDLVQWT